MTWPMPPSTASGTISTLPGRSDLKVERRHLLWQALNSQKPIGEAEVTLAYDVADAAFNRVWHDQHVTWTIRSEGRAPAPAVAGAEQPETDRRGRGDARL